MENAALRDRFGLLGKASGVMLSRIPPESSVHGVLRVRDILTEVDGVSIANDGTIQLPGTQDLVRVTFSYLVYRAPRLHPLRLAVLRDRKRQEFVVPARPQPELLLVCKPPLPKPQYLVVGGLVFVPLLVRTAACRTLPAAGAPPRAPPLTLSPAPARPRPSDPRLPSLPPPPPPPRSCAPSLLVRSERRHLTSRSCRGASLTPCCASLPSRGSRWCSC